MTSWSQQGVERFIPAEISIDLRNSPSVVLLVCVPEVETQRHLQEKVNSTQAFYISVSPKDYS